MDVEHGLNSEKYSNPPPLSGWSFVDYVNFCHFHWWVSYWILMVLTKKPGEWCCRLLTVVHGCTASYLAIRDILDDKQKFLLQNAPLSDGQRHYIAFMLSYYLYDFAWMRLFGNESWLIHIHHVSSIFIMIKLVASNYGGVGVSYVVTGLEVTNPFLQLRWFLRTYGYQNYFIFKALEIWFFCMFFLVRVIGETLIFYYVSTTTKTDFLIEISMLCIYLVSLAFAWQMLLYMHKKYWKGSLHFARSKGLPSSEGRADDNIDSASELGSISQEPAFKRKVRQRRREPSLAGESASFRSEEVDDTEDKWEVDIPILKKGEEEKLEMERKKH